MNIVKLLIVSTLLSLNFGQLIRIPISSEPNVLTITDILTTITIFSFLIYTLTIKRSLKLESLTFPIVSLFALFAFSSTILALTVFSKTEILISTFFLLRFIIYFAFSIVIYNLVVKEKVTSWINFFLFTQLIFMTLGFIGFFLFPDLSFLTIYGWDPHQKRIVSTLLDPNFSGALFMITISFAISYYLYFKEKKYLLYAVYAFFALILTFSRSSYLALIVAALTIGVLKSPKLILIITLAFSLVFLVNQKVRSRIIGAFTLDETAQARLESWNNALTIFKRNFLFGVGFNTYRYTQARYGFFDSDNPQGGHSGAGSDSSILTTAATTGIIGLIFYLILLFSIFKIYLRHAKNYPLHLASLASFLGLLVHSQFVNSLFFPK